MVTTVEGQQSVVGSFAFLGAAYPKTSDFSTTISLVIDQEGLPLTRFFLVMMSLMVLYKCHFHRWLEVTIHSISLEVTKLQTQPRCSLGKQRHKSTNNRTVTINEIFFFIYFSFSEYFMPNKVRQFS